MAPISEAVVHEGLEGVVVTRTRLSGVDGEAGQLVIAGWRVEDLAGAVPFEAVCARLWERPSVDLGPARVQAFARLPSLGTALEAAEPMDALRAAVAHLPSTAGAEEVTAAVAVFAAAWQRRRTGQSPVAPQPALPHAADTLRMVRGEPAPAALVRGLDTYLSTVVDHGLNASTFTRARHRLHRLGPRVRGGGCTRGAEGTAARRRARAGAGHAGRGRGLRSVPRRGCPGSCPPAGASWAWDTASTACATRGRRFSKRRWSAWNPAGMRTPRLVLARAVERDRRPTCWRSDIRTGR